MPQSLVVLRVLISSPSDLNDERELLAETIDELNATWRRSGNVQLVPVRWETDVRPALGPDAQAVINQQIGDDYDIFVGIMGARFGTPTGRAESGTEEEFGRAVERFQRDPTRVSVMLYFKDAAPTSLSEIDPDQLSKVQQFQEKTKTLGLIRMFKTRDEFARLMRMHLSQEVQEWSRRLVADTRGAEQHVSNKVAQQSTAPNDILDEQNQCVDEEGYLDLIEQGADAMEEFTHTVERMAGAVNEVGSRAVEQSAAMEEAKLTGDVRVMKRVSNQMASFMNEFAARLEAEIPIFSAGGKRAIDCYTRAIGMAEITGETPEQMSNAIAAVEGLISSHGGAITNHRQLRDTIAGLPRITTAFNKAKRHTVAALSQLLEETEKSVRLNRELLEILIKRRDGLL